MVKIPTIHEVKLSVLSGEMGGAGKTTIRESTQETR